MSARLLEASQIKTFDSHPCNPPSRPRQQRRQKATSSTACCMAMWDHSQYCSMASGLLQAPLPD